MSADRIVRYAYPRRFIIALLALMLALASARTSFAQDIYSYALRLPISDEQATVGDIISKSQEGAFVRSSVAFDDRIIGVLSETAMVTYEEADEGEYVVTDGKSTVHVTTLNGEIKAGDYLTSSPIAGYAQNAQGLSGIMLGIALDDFDGQGADSITYEEGQYASGEVSVSVHIGPVVPAQQSTVTNVVDQFAALLFKSSQSGVEANKMFRYVIAFIITLAAILVSFLTFGKSVARGIEAMGRNPLAKTQIQAMIIMNVVLIGIISIGAIILSLAIIRF